MFMDMNIRSDELELLTNDASNEDLLYTKDRKKWNQNNLKTPKMMK